MERDALPTVPPTATMRDAVVPLATRRGIAIVVEQSRVIGVVTAGDLTWLLDREQDVLTVPVAQVMSTTPRVAQDHELGSAVVHRMGKHMASWRCRCSTTPSIWSGSCICTTCCGRAPRDHTSARVAARVVRQRAAGVDDGRVLDTVGHGQAGGRQGLGHPRLGRSGHHRPANRVDRSERRQGTPAQRHGVHVRRRSAPRPATRQRHVLHAARAAGWRLDDLAHRRVQLGAVAARGHRRRRGDS